MVKRAEREAWRRLRGASWACVDGPDGELVLRHLLPDPEAVLAAARQLPGRGRFCNSYRVDLDGRSFFVKSYPLDAFGERLKNLLRGSRALRSWRLSRLFACCGIPVPRALALLQEGRCWPGRSLLVTDFIDNACTFREAWTHSGAAGRRRLLDQAALLLGRLHAAGALHGDTHWDNILARHEEGGARLFLIDFFGGRLAGAPGLAALQRDLAHFLRDLYAHSGRFVEDKACFLQAWWDCLPSGLKSHRTVPADVPLTLSRKRKVRMIDRIRAQFEQHVLVARQVSEQLAPAIAGCIEMLASALLAGGKVLVLGNGGSAADAQHFVAELVGRFQVERKALPAIALTTDTSILTAVGNDYGFDEIFARQVQALARPGDIVFGISTSGNSENVLRALAAAGEIGCRTVGLTGSRGGKLADLADVALVVPSSDTPRIQEAHGMIIHVICENLERTLFGKQA